MKGDEKGKPHISIPQKSAVAIVPPKKVHSFCLLPRPGLKLDSPAPAGFVDLPARTSKDANALDLE